MADQSRNRSGSSRPSTGRASAASSRPSGASPAGRGTGAGRATTATRGGWRRVLLLAVTGLLALMLVGMLAVVVFYNRTSLPDPNKDFTTNTTFVYYNDGKTKLGSYAVQNRQSLTYSQMPQSIKDAVVAAENRTFWTDRGISPSGIVRSAWTIARGGEVQGGSTITQQYIKILYLSSDRTMTRKLRELALAVKMGKKLSKQEILQGYLNTIYFGRGAYGVQAASRAYFNVDAGKLTVPQAAVLAAVLNNPAIYDPSVNKANTARLLARYRYVLDGMQQAGKITAAQATQYSKALPALPNVPLSQRWSGTNGYLLRMVEDELIAKGMTQEQVEGGGLKIVTTFDKTMEDRAVAVGQKYKQLVGDNASAGPSKLHPAIASVKVGTGEVLAIYGGDDYLKNSRNWATTDRPAASTFKAYATVAALRGGLSMRSILQGDTFTPSGDSVSVRNENSMQYGSVRLSEALTKSINTAYVDAVTRISNGPQNVIKAANDAGVPKGAGWEANDRIPLGIAEVSPLENANGYATFANEGVSVASHVVSKVTDSKGKSLYTGSTTGKQTIQKDVADEVSWGLEGVTSSSGTGYRAAELGRQVAGKTGTNGVTRNGQGIITSAWFVAYTKQISTAVMYVAGDDGNQALDPYKRYTDTTFFGGTYPAMTWVDYMQTAMQGLPYEDLPSRSYYNYGTDTSMGRVYVPQATRTATQSSTSGQAGSGTSSASAGSSSAPTASSTGTGSTTQPTTGSTATSQPTQQQTSQPTQQATTQPAATQPAATQPAATQPANTQTQQQATQPAQAPTTKKS